MTKVFKKGTVYENYTQLGPVLDAVESKDYWRVNWFRQNDGEPWLGIPKPDDFPVTLYIDIPIPQPEHCRCDCKEPPKPLTVEEMRLTWMRNQGAWFWHDYNNCPMHNKALTAFAALNIPCYATEDDCKRAHALAHDMGVE